MKSRTLVTAIVLVAGAGIGLGYLGPGHGVAAQAQSTPSPSVSATSTPSPSADAIPTEITLVFTSPPPSDATDPCHSGATGKSNEIGDHDDLLVCTFNSFGRPAPTDSSGYGLAWSLEPAQSSETVGVRFNPEPPGNTSGSSAMAHAGIDAVAASDNRITVTLSDAAGQPVATSSVDKLVCCTGDHGPIPTALTARLAKRSVHGIVRSSEAACRRRRSVTLWRRRQGRDEEIGTDVSDRDGRWRAPTGRRAGTYYARVSGAVRSDEPGVAISCLADQSNVVRRS